MPRRSSHPLLLALAACQPVPGAVDGAPCAPDPPPVGEVIVDHVRCGGRLVPGGDGRVGDLYVANAWFRAVLRDPGSALTVPGVGGATLIDAAPREAPDRLRELIPLVGGGWLDVHDLRLEPDGVVVAGVVTSLPGTRAADAGAWAEVRWSPDPHGPWLRLEGAQAYLLHPLGGLVLDGQVVAGTTYAHDGNRVVDYGGAVRVEGATGVLIAPDAEAPGWWAADPTPLRGEAPDADTIALYREGARVGALPVSASPFDLLIQGDVDAVRAEAADRAPGPLTPPGEGLTLAPGAPGTLRIAPLGVGGAPPPAWVRWSDDAGRDGAVFVPPGGATLALGAGTYTLQADAGPAIRSTSATVRVAPDARGDARLVLADRFDPGDRVLADLSGYGARSDTSRGTDTEALAHAAGLGRGFVVVAPEHSAAGTRVDDAARPPIRWRDGVTLTAPDGWRITAWPISATTRHGGLGAPAINDLTPRDALAAAWGGPGTNRFTVVDLAWLRAVGPPWTVAPRPDLLRLDPPGPTGPTGGAWQPWFDWLSAGAALVPTGPLVWATVDDPSAFAGVDVEQALTRGDVVATTGGLVTLTVNGVPPGESLPSLEASPSPKPPRATLEVASAEDAFDRVFLIADGAIVATWSLDAPGGVFTAAVPRDARWVIAAAQDATGTHWAATGPVWTRAPTQPTR